MVSNTKIIQIMTTYSPHWSVKWLMGFINFIWYILLFGTILVVIVLGTRTVFPDIFGPETLNVNVNLPLKFAEEFPVPIEFENHGFSVEDLNGKINVSKGNFYLFIFNTIFAIFYMIISIMILHLIRMIFRNIRKGIIFVEANSKFFMMVSFMFFVMFVYDGLAKFIMGIVLNQHPMFANNQLSIVPDLSFDLLGFFLLSLVFSKVFNEGVKLKAENELTI
ncbi:MAG: hypothetical protein ACJATA_000641 [Sphingobacteriales bacterium]